MACRPAPTVFSCEVCGEGEFNEDDLRQHVAVTHLAGTTSCPFCDLGDISSEEMLLHVNTVHLDYMTPGNEDVAFIDDDTVKSPKPDVVDLTGMDDSPRHNMNERGGYCNGVTSPDDSLGKASCGSPLRTQLSLNLRKKNSSAPPVLRSPAVAAAAAAAISRNEVNSCPMCAYASESVTKLQEHINRQHFDLTSPSFPFLSPDDSDNDVFNCPLCDYTFETANDLELHVNLDHRDILSPAKATLATPGDENSNESCPVCSKKGFKTSQEMASHIEEHFNQNVSPITPDMSCDRLLAREMEQREREVRKLREQKEFELLKAQYGMDEQGNFCEQSLTNMQRAVCAGEMTVADYYERQIELRVAEKCGVDDGSSCTKGLIAKIQAVSLSSNNVQEMYTCTTVDHYASTYGDRGWGCGYRNIQMLISSALHHTAYYDILSTLVENPVINKPSVSKGNNVQAAGPSNMQNSSNLNRVCVPSISNLQQLIEKGWKRGFDTAGCEQLGGRLHNTRKWIGATEVVTLFSSFRIKCQLIDFHRPTAPDGTHPQLFQWVFRHFQKNEDFKFPLYLQHQGHSRTIVGAERWRDGSIHLLVLDPSQSPTQMTQLKNTVTAASALRLIRKSLTVMQARQYQIVSIVGLMESEQEYQHSKVFRSLRIPGDQ